MSVLYDASKDMDYEIEKKIRGNDNIDGISISTCEVRLANMEVMVSSSSTNWRLIKDLCDPNYSYDPNVIYWGKYEKKKQGVHIFSKSIPEQEEAKKTIFLGTILLNFCYDLGHHNDDFSRVVTVLRELEKRVDKSVIVANHNVEFLRKMKKEIPQIQTATTYNKANSCDLTAPCKTDYIFFDFQQKKKLDEKIREYIAASGNKYPFLTPDITLNFVKSTLERYIYNELTMPDIFELSKEIEESELLRLLNIFNKKNRGEFPCELSIDEITMLIDFIMKMKLKQVKESLSEGRKVIVISSEESDKNLSDIMKCDNGDNLIVSTRNPELIKIRKTA